MNKNMGSRIFLTELMFSIFFFIVIASVCVQCFAHGYRLSHEADELTQAVNVSSNAAEQFYARDDFDSFTSYYDESWHKVEEPDAAYRVTGIKEEAVEGFSYMETLSIRVSKTNDEEEIYSLQVKKGKPLED